MSKAIFIILILFSVKIFAQETHHYKTQIVGRFVGKSMNGDTILFVMSAPEKYFQKLLRPVVIRDNSYQVENEITYPEMFRIVFSSEKKRGRLWHDGIYFVDSTTSRITSNIDADGCNKVNNPTQDEYEQIFMPYITDGGYDCKTYKVDEVMQDQNVRKDTLLYRYVKTHPSSFVALWWLISRFDYLGESPVRLNTLNYFSRSLKKTYIWKELNNDFKNVKLKIGNKFPEINVKTLALVPQKIHFPKARYILIDYWYSRCKPCLDTIPVLKKLYAKYKGKGFEIVSISVDITKNIPIWQKRVEEHGLEWPQFLEENNWFNNELGIREYPTFMLLDNNDKVILKDFDLHQLDTFLSKNI
jgi:thiol-disulfide isomerase/thioredoxin